MMSPAKGWDRETSLVAQIAACVSVASFLYYLRSDQILLYGDAVAHINIARRIFDSRTPGLLQLGTVWLPLPHLLMAPFLLSDWMWQTGIGGSIPSLFSFVFSAVGIFRLVRGSEEAVLSARIAAWLAVVIFVANPNLVYLQSTALTEPVYLVFFIWATLYFTEFVREAEKDPASNSKLMKCAGCLAAASLTRYDGWFLIAAVGVAVIVFLVKQGPARLRGPVVTFLLLAAVAPAVWLGYNAIVYRNPLEFANGPYSAKAIERRTSPPGSPPHPGTANLPLAASYFVKAAELNVAEGNLHRLWLGLAVGGAALLLIFRREKWPLLLLWIPVPFYAISIAYSGVPIFLPAWWPFSLYNVRYGIELLPAFAVFCAVGVSIAWEWLRDSRGKIGLVAAVLAVVAVSYGLVWKAKPVSFREGWVNSRTRTQIEQEMARNLKRLPENSTFLMYLGDHVGALQRAGIPLRRVINEGNHRPWLKPSDSQGLWERALEDPREYADFVVAGEGDEVALKARTDQLSAILVIHVLGQPTVTVYSSGRTPK